MSVSETFDDTKKYKELEIAPGQFVASEDFNHIQDLQNWDRRRLSEYQTGFTLTINHMTNVPVLKVKSNFDLTGGQILEFEMVDATHVRWRKNGGAWSAGIVVVCDNSTWNVIGTSGCDIVFSDTVAAADASEVWVARAMRLVGGALSSPLANSFTLEEGHWQILGEYEEFADVTVAGTANDDYVYLKVERINVTHLTDPEIGHRLADSNYANVSPEAVNRVYTLMATAAFPANVVSPYTQYIVVGKVINAAAGTITPMWYNPMDFQRFIRVHADEQPPIAPTGLTLTTGSESSLSVVVATRAKVNSPSTFGWLKMTCTANAEADLAYYEFKITRLDAAHAVTSDTFTQLVYDNQDAGGVAIPLGINYTMHNQFVGIEFRVQVRAVDLSGNVGAWCVKQDEYIGGTCAIAGGAAGPTFTLVDTPNFVGLEIIVSAVPVNTDGFSVYVGEGSYPDPALVDPWRSFASNVSSVKVPWKESGYPFVRLMAYDAAGLYHNNAGAPVYTSDNVQLASSAQLSSETHNDSVESHSGTIADILECQTKYGSVYNWLIRISNQGWDLQNLYIVGEDGATYGTVTAALNAIVLDAPTFATILVGPGAFEGAATITFPDFYDAGSGGATTRVAIVGMGPDTSIINADWDLVDVSIAPKPLSFPLMPGDAGLYLCNLTISGYITGTKAAATFGAIVFDNVCVMDNALAQPLVHFDGGAAGGWYIWVLNNSYFMNTGANYTLSFQRDVDFYLASSRFLQYDIPGATFCIYLTTPTGAVRTLLDCQLQVENAGVGRVLESNVGATNVTLATNVTSTAWGANINPVTGGVVTNTNMGANFLIT